MRKLFTLLLMMVSVQVFAQTNPIVAINITLPANPDANIANWGTGTSVFAISATTKSATGRIDPSVEESKILVIIKKAGSKVCGAYTSSSAPASNFNTLTKVWRGGSAIGLLGKDCTLPPGDYELSVQFFGYSNGKMATLSDEKIKPFTIKGNDQQTYQSANPVFPANGTTFTETDIKKPITFRWTPVIPKTQEPVTYRLRVWQLVQGQTAAQAITANKPLMSNEYDNATQATITHIIDGPCKPPYLCDFVWNVQALGKDGKPIGANYGTSEAFRFSVASASCGSIVADTTIKCKGTDPRTGLAIYSVTIKLKNQPTSNSLGCNASFTNLVINSGGGNVSSLTGLPVTIASNNSATISFDYVPGSSSLTNAAFRVNGNWSDALGNSVNTLVTLGLPRCLTCDCGKWGVLSVKTATRPLIYTCGAKIPWHCSQPFTFNSSYTCASASKDCQAKISWDVKQSGGGIIQSGNTSGGTFTPTANGTYIITLNADCNGKACEPCTYYITINDCKETSCDCGKWGTLNVKTATRPLIYTCGSKIAWNCKKPFTFASSYECTNTAGKPCAAEITWDITLNGNQVLSGNTSSGTFTPTANGVYTVTLNASCNGKKCEPCTYYITVNDCKETSCDCGKWGTLSVKTATRPLIYACGAKIQWHCSQPFTFNSSYTCASVTKDCEAKITWDVKQSGGGIIQSGTTSGGTFTPTANGTYVVTLNASCGGKICEPCVYYITVSDCSPFCTCGKWDPLKVQNAVGTKYYQCGSKIAWNCSRPFSFSTTYHCSPDDKSCLANVGWQIKKDGVLVKEGAQTSSLNDSFTPNENGTYTITLNATCNGKQCEPCTYTIIVTDCKETSCDCGKWGPLNVKTVTRPLTFDCGAKIPWHCSAPFKFSTSYTCTSNSKDCQANILWFVKQTGGGTIQSGNTNSGSFTPTANGTYTITLRAECNGKTCDPCTYTVVVTDCKSEPCPTLCNGDFEQILNGQAPAWNVQTAQNNIPCWKTTASDGLIEIWHSGFNGVAANTGTYFAEINATMPAALYQTFTIADPKTVVVSFAHRGRYSGADIMKVSLVPLTGPAIPLGTYSDNNSHWTVYHTAATLIPGGTYKLQFVSVSSNGGKGPPDGGNFLDSVSISCADNTDINSNK